MLITLEIMFPIFLPPWKVWLRVCIMFCSKVSKFHVRFNRRVESYSNSPIYFMPIKLSYRLLAVYQQNHV